MSGKISLEAIDKDIRLAAEYFKFDGAKVFTRYPSGDGLGKIDIHDRGFARLMHERNNGFPADLLLSTTIFCSVDKGGNVEYRIRSSMGESRSKDIVKCIQDHLKKVAKKIKLNIKELEDALKDIHEFI